MAGDSRCRACHAGRVHQCFRGHAARRERLHSPIVWDERREIIARQGLQEVVAGISSIDPRSAGFAGELRDPKAVRMRLGRILGGREANNRAVSFHVDLKPMIAATAELNQMTVAVVLRHWPDLGVHLARAAIMSCNKVTLENQIGKGTLW